MFIGTALREHYDQRSHRVQERLRAEQQRLEDVVSLRRLRIYGYYCYLGLCNCGQLPIPCLQQHSRRNHDHHANPGRLLLIS